MHRTLISAAVFGLTLPTTATVSSAARVVTGGSGTQEASTLTQDWVIRPAARGSIKMTSPTKDTSTYSNIGSSGNTRPYVWANYFPGEGRQSALVTMFNTAAEGAPTGSVAARVRVTKAVFTVATYLSGPQAQYDPTPDPWQSLLWGGGEINVFEFLGSTTVVGVEQIPADPRYIALPPEEQDNAPVELFGARFNNGLSAATWDESSFGTPGWSGGTPNIEPIDYDENGDVRPVNQNVGETAVNFVEGLYPPPDGPYFTTFPDPDQPLLADPADGFDPNPLAIGVSVDVPDGTPGQRVFGMGQTAIGLGDDIPLLHRFVFEMDVTDPDVQRYLREGLQEGWVSFVLSQLAFGDLSTRRYSYWMTKEGSASLPRSGPPSNWVDVDPATLELEWIPIQIGDLDLDNRVGFFDLIWLLQAVEDVSVYESAFPQIDARATADQNGDGSLDVLDVVEMIRLVETDTSRFGRPSSRSSGTADPAR